MPKGKRMPDPVIEWLAYASQKRRHAWHPFAHGASASNSYCHAVVRSWDAAGDCGRDIPCCQLCKVALEKTRERLVERRRQYKDDEGLDEYFRLRVAEIDAALGVCGEE